MAATSVAGLKGQVAGGLRPVLSRSRHLAIERGDDVGETHRQLRALAKLAPRGCGDAPGRMLTPVQLVNQHLEILGQQLLPEGWIATRAGQIVVRHGSKAGHGMSPGRSRVRVAASGLHAVTGEGRVLRLDIAARQVSFAENVKREGEMSAAFIFPGQGSQTVGMGKALADAFPAARQVFEEVDAALGAALTRIIWEGPADQLTLTENAQPALMATSLAAIRALEAEAGLDLARDVRFVAGHSLGEYSALAAAGAISVADTARLLRLRGQAMQKAVPVGAGAMAALLGLDYEDAAAVAAEAAQGEVCQAANDNGGGQVVVSGSKAAVERAVEIAKGRGAKRAMMLPVSAPFHCALMQPAADAMAEALARVTVKAPVVPVVANVVARAVTDPAEIVRNLVAQVTATVRWRECVAYMAGQGVTSFYEIGAGKVLSGLVRRIADGASATAIGTPEDVAGFVRAQDSAA
jgi:[acyl-carrier-protein] S-malonyltransferase